MAVLRIGVYDWLVLHCVSCHLIAFSSSLPEPFYFSSKSVAICLRIFFFFFFFFFQFVVRFYDTLFAIPAKS